MTQQAVIDTNSKEQAPTGDASLDSKAEAVFAKFRKETVDAIKSEPDEDAADDTPTEPASPKAKRPPEPAPSPDPKLAKLLEQERLIRQREAAAARREREAEEKARGVDERITKAEAVEKLWAGGDENADRILELLETKVGPEKLVEWFGKMGDPAYRAKLEAKRVAEASKPDLSPIEKRLEAIEARNRELEIREVKGQVQGQISELVKAYPEEVPFAHRLLERKPDKFWRRVESKARELSASEKEGGRGLVFGQDYNMNDVILQIESDLKDDHDSLAAEQAAANAEPTKQVIDTPAAGKAPTSLSNRDASVRTTLEHAPPRQKMDDKIARLIRQARRES